MSTSNPVDTPASSSVMLADEAHSVGNVFISVHDHHDDLEASALSAKLVDVHQSHEIIHPKVITTIQEEAAEYHPDRDIAVRYQQASQTISIRLDAKQAAISKAVNEDTLKGSPEGWEDQWVHYVPLDQLIKRVGSDLDMGMTKVQQVNGRRVAKNVMSPPHTEHWLIRLAKVSLGGFNWLLLIIATLDVLSWKPLGNYPGPPQPINWYTGVTLFICIFVNTCFNAYQLRKTSNLIASFSSMIPTVATVLSDGKWAQINSAELQVGDIVRLDTGIKVPADLRLLTCQGIKVDKSLLTGESEAILCSTKCTSKNYLETRNVVFFGTMIVEGTGTGLVIDIGDNTVMGKIGKMTSSAQTKRTTLEVEIDRFVRIILTLIFFTGAAGLIAWGTWIRVDYPDYLTVPSMVANMAAFVVGYTPEGLQVALTMTLSIVAKRLAKFNVLVKDLAVIETFNTISLIASDKTGTLTLNKMSVANIIWGLESEQTQSLVTGTADNSKCSLLQVPMLRRLFRCATLCNSAERTNPSTSTSDGSTTTVKGDASDTALFNWAESTLNVANYRTQYPTLAALPFNSRNKFAVTVHEQLMNKNAPKLLFMKGAPEIILSRCSHVLMHDKDDEESPNSIRPLTAEERVLWAAEQARYSSQGQRVLGFAMRYLDSSRYSQGSDFSMTDENDPDYLCRNLIFLGVISLIDPPRPEVPDAIAKCKSAHIRVAMVTGDHPDTAAAIAQQIGLLSLPDRHSFDVREDGFGVPLLSLKLNGETIGSYRFGASSDSPVTDSLFFGMDAEGAQSVTPLTHQWSKAAPHSEKIAAGIVLTGTQLSLLDERMWNWVLRHEQIVFARTTPEQKLKIVTESQRLGERVACCGDGTNDAPCLRASDLGIAMFAGSEVAREAGHVILLDNNFGSIVTGIELGRAVYDNLKKVIIYLLPAGTWSEMLTIMFNIFLGIQPMLSAFLMIIICLLTDVFVSIAMVNEHAESDVMQRKPRDRNERLINIQLLLTAYFTTGCFMTFAASFNFFWYAADQGLPFWGVFWAFGWGEGWYGFTADELAEIVRTGQCIYFVTLVIMQWGNAFAVRTRRQSIIHHNPFWGPHRNLYLPVGMLAAFITLIVITLGPFFQTYFGTRQVPIKYALVACGWSVFLVLWDEARKWIVRNRPDSWVAKAAW